MEWYREYNSGFIDPLNMRFDSNNGWAGPTGYDISRDTPWRFESAQARTRLKDPRRSPTSRQPTSCPPAPIRRGTFVAQILPTMYGMNQAYNVPQDPSGQVPNQLVSAPTLRSRNIANPPASPHPLGLIVPISDSPNFAASASARVPHKST